MQHLDFISNDLLLMYVGKVLESVAKAYAASDEKIGSNVIDPFSALFDSMSQGITLEEWYKQEKVRQVQKTLMNAIGDFHQNVLGSVSGWHNPGRGGGYDIISEDNRVLAEIKNKFNTMNSSASETTYKKLVRYIEGEFKGYTGYVVFIVPKDPGDYNLPWSPSHTAMPLREDIRKIDGESFYGMVTKNDNALEELFLTLPACIAQFLESKALSEEQKNLIIELFQRAYK